MSCDTGSGHGPAVVRSLIPARMDRLPWSPFHTRLVVALGVTWVLDGLEITLASLIGPVLQSEQTLHLSSVQIGTTASVYLVGEVAGALFFGHLADRLGRRRLFLATLALYLTANGLTALSFGFASLLVFRFLAGAGIGGEYAAINSAIDELIPARWRGHTDLAINGTYWLGALIGALAERVLLDPDVLPIDVGWRIGLLLGPLIGVGIWAMRRALPESPRWLLMRGRADEAERTVDAIERELAARGYPLPPVDPSRTIAVRATGPMGYGTLAALTFFVGSAAASSAYLTVSEIFPLEVRSQALALFFAVAQIVGATGPVIFGSLIGDREHPDATRLLAGYALAAAMMIAGGVVGAAFGVRAERTALEDVATPLSAASDE